MTGLISKAIEVGVRQRYPRLFSPVTLGAMRLENRIVVPAIQAGFARNHDLGERFIERYAQLARGGAGMIVLEATTVHPASGPHPTMPIAYRSSDRAAFAHLAEIVEGAGCRLVAQLHHTGSSRVAADGAVERIAPSPVPDFYSGEVPRAMTPVEIDETVSAFVSAAAVFASAGFSGVEVHAAHGHLLSRFLSPHWNERTDSYGGSLHNRTRIVREIVAGVRAACGADFVVGLRITGDEGIPDGIGPAQAAAVLTDICSATPVDYVSLTQGTVAPNFGDHIPDMHYPPTPFLPLTSDLRARIGAAVPVIAVGRIRTADDAERALSEGCCDLVAMGRALIADPDLPRKARSGGEVRRCLYCNLCWGRVQAGQAGECVVNPGWGRPSPLRVTRRRRITVVGGGVAGLEAAAGIAERGHEVTLLHGPRLGGKIAAESTLPGRAELGLLVNELHRRAIAAGVGFRELPRPADADAVLAEAPDAVILATGARMPRPTLFADAESVSDVGIRELVDGIQQPRDSPLPTGDRRGVLVVVDDYHDTAVYALTELLAPDHARTVLLCTRPEIGAFVPWVGRLGIQRRLSAAGVDCVTSVVPVAWEPGALRYRSADGTLTTQPHVDRIIWATTRTPDLEIADRLTRAGVPYHVVGDASGPKTLVDAIEHARTLVADFH
ncbi:NAD(P)-binding protein [Nocardia sp. NBC_01730]|uniref:oxidoreductase n=1 Tax=Nocardia sp. NBC_01730 TaxID=2975998 RepID=UPI002E0EBBE8|nr:NAD(P)-binding protein [Nocardia sp. NBC_01730]